MKRIASICVVVALFVASCSSGDSASSPATISSAPTTAATGTTVISATTLTTASATASTVAQTTTPDAAPITSLPATTIAPPTCAARQAIAIVDSTIALARLDPGGTWEPEGESTVFAERTNDAAEFGARLGFDCAERLVQHRSDGAERLALVAWNDARHAAVIQATDPPSLPYATAIRFQLFVEQPLGEWLEEGFVWAATLSGGESIVIDTQDYSTGVTAKSWQSFVPRFEDLPVTLESEQFGIAALTAVGARNVSVAEPAPHGSTIGTIQFNTPRALGVFAVIGPAGSFDPMAPIVPDGDSTFSTIDGVEIRSTVGKELGEFDLFETGWSCGDHEWRLYAGLGSPAELTEFSEMLVRSLEC